MAVGGLAGCGVLDALDATFSLAPQDYKQDFGTRTGMVPSIMCPLTPDPCATGATALQTMLQPNGGMITGTCDTAASRCAFKTNITVKNPITLAMDQSFATGVAGKAVSILKALTLSYEIPRNTLSVGLPESQIYIAPMGTADVTSPQAALLGKIPAISKGQTIAAGGGSIKVDVNSPAGQQLTQYLKNPTTPFLFLLNTQPTLTGGSALPSGDIQVRITPSITVGFPSVL